MNWVRGFGVCLVCFGLVGWANAQGSAAGYGQGGGRRAAPGTGGFAGGIFATMPLDEEKRPEDDRDRLWESKTAILTPGDRVEFKFKVDEGEAIYASVTSDAFDPALAIEDSHGKTLAQNDDRIEGDQSPFLAFRFPSAGTYMVKVLSFRSVSGGKFTIKTRRFKPIDVSTKPMHWDTPQGREPNEDTITVFRLSAQKGKTYDVSRFGARTRQSIRISSFRRVVGPTGVMHADYRVLPSRDSRPAFTALATGDYYIEWDTYSCTHFDLDVREVAVLKMEPASTVSFACEPNELKVIEFKVEPGLIVRTKTEGAELKADWRFQEPDSGLAPGAPPRTSPSYGLTSYSYNARSELDVVNVFQYSGTAQLVLSGDKGGTAKVTNTLSLPEWTENVNLSGSLGVGESRFFLLKSTKSQIMNVFVGSTHFLPMLAIYWMDGNQANRLSDWKTLSAKDDLYFPEEGMFIVQVSCAGDGGSGDYEMRRQSFQPTEYALESVQELKLTGQNFGLYGAKLEAGKRYELVLDGIDVPTNVDLLDDDGQFLVSQQVMLDKTVVHYFVPTKTGVHRLWLRGTPGTHKFRLQLHATPSLGG